MLIVILRVSTKKITFKNLQGDFPGSPVVKTPASTAGGTGSIPGQGTKIPHATWHSQKKKINRTGNEEEIKITQ